MKISVFLATFLFLGAFALTGCGSRTESVVTPQDIVETPELSEADQAEYDRQMEAEMSQQGN